jgi:hypothetical protein
MYKTVVRPILADAAETRLDIAYLKKLWELLKWQRYGESQEIDWTTECWVNTSDNCVTARP